MEPRLPLVPPGMRAVLFDIDGTLLDTHEFIVQAFEYALRRHGYPVPPRNALISLVIGQSLVDGYAALNGGDRDVAELIETHRTFQEHHLDLCSAYAGAAEVLAVLRERGFRLAAVTNRSRRTSVKTLEMTGLAPFFDVVVSSEDTPRPKPYPDPLFIALEALAVAPEEALIVGDSAVDMEAGRSAGVFSIAVTNGGADHRLAGSRPNLVIPSLAALLPLLRASLNGDPAAGR